MKIKTGDKVKILSGKDKGKTGKVIQLLFNKRKATHYVVVEGINILKKHIRSGRRSEKGQIIELPAPIHISNIMLIDPNSSKATRVAYKTEGKDKKRLSKKSGEYID